MASVPFVACRDLVRTVFLSGMCTVSDLDDANPGRPFPLHTSSSQTRSPALPHHRIVDSESARDGHWTALPNSAIRCHYTCVWILGRCVFLPGQPARLCQDGARQSVRVYNQNVLTYSFSVFYWSHQEHFRGSYDSATVAWLLNPLENFRDSLRILMGLVFHVRFQQMLFHNI